HVRVDSKIGAEQTDFHLKLETEGGDIRGLIYNGPGWPKGGGKRAILAAIEEDPDATPKEIADRIGVTPRYVQKLVKEHSQAGSRTGERQFAVCSHHDFECSHFGSHLFAENLQSLPAE